MVRIILRTVELESIEKEVKFKHEVVKKFERVEYVGGSPYYEDYSVIEVSKEELDRVISSLSDGYLKKLLEGKKQYLQQTGEW